MSKRLLGLLNNITEDNTEHNSYRDKRVLLIDGNNTFVRGYSAVNKINKFGNHIGGIVGFLTSIGYAVKNIRPTRVIIIFDGVNGAANRKYLYPQYKGTRDNGKLVNSKIHISLEEEDDSMDNQLTRLIDYLMKLPVTIICNDHLEADDIIGFASQYYCKKYSDASIHIMSGDRDFLQLVNDRICVYNPGKKKYYYTNDVIEEFGVHPNNYIIYKCLVGDTSDNITGIIGFGEKTSVKLFPELRDSHLLDLPSLYVLSEQKQKGSKLYSRVLLSKSDLNIFYKIMDLKNPNIADDYREDIIMDFDNDPYVFKRYEFIRMAKLDDVEIAMRNLDSWLNAFSYLSAFSKNIL